MSPESLGKVKDKFNYQPDIWAAGVLLYLMMYGNFPFNGENIDYSTYVTQHYVELVDKRGMTEEQWDDMHKILYYSFFVNP